MQTEEVRIRQLTIADEQVETEILRFDVAVRKVVDEINVIRLHTEEQLGDSLGAILVVQTQLLTDESLRQQIKDKIRYEKMSAEHAVTTILGSIAKRLAGVDDQILAHRDSDIYDIQKRLLRVLVGARREDLSHLERPVAVIAHDLGPSQTASLDRTKVKAFVTDVGGRASHTAILARAFELPAVVGVESISTDIAGGETIIIDGNSGIVVLRPDERTLARYRKVQQEFETFEQALIKEKDLPAVTLDGREVHVHGNIELPGEVQGAIAHGAGGIGLYRTEFLYLIGGVMPDEATHFEAYRSALAQLQGRPLVIRTLDLGADKVIPQYAYHERNPFLGLRSIRVSMRYPETFRVQVRAILRASALGKVRVMLPMVTAIEELRWARRILEETKQELKRQGHGFDDKVPLGIMVEVPAAALAARSLAKEADFFSIGTNDLTQYTLAVDRSNELVAGLFSAAHPAVLALIRNTIEAAEEAKIPVGMCGEMASDPIFTALLLGMGMKELSVAPPAIPEIKKIIRNVSYEKCRAVAEQVRTMDETGAILDFLRERLSGDLPGGGQFGGG